MADSNSKMAIYIRAILKMESIMGTENLKHREGYTMGSLKAGSMKEEESIDGRMDRITMESIETGKEMVLGDW